MQDDRHITFFYAPQTRALGTLVLLEELGAPYELRVLDTRNGETRQPDYLKINPLGKVPAILDGDALVTEQGAIFIHLADRFPAAGLAPPLGDPLRGPYLRWLVLYGSSLEPAMVDRALKRPPAAPTMSPYGDGDSVVKLIETQLARGPYLLGDRFTAADVLWGVALHWLVGFKIFPESPSVKNYIARVTSRPAYVKSASEDTEHAARRAAPKS